MGRCRDMKGRAWMDGSVEVVLVLRLVGEGHCLCLPEKHICGIRRVYWPLRSIYGVRDIVFFLACGSESHTL